MIILCILFAVSATIFVIIYKNAPHLTDEERTSLLKFPRGVEDLRRDLEIINRYFKDHTAYVYLVFCYLYITL